MKRRLSIALACAALTVLCAACTGHSPSATRSASQLEARDLAATLRLADDGDWPLEVKSATIAEVFSSVSDEPFRRVLAEAGKTPADVILAVARNTFETLLDVISLAVDRSYRLPLQLDSLGDAGTRARCSTVHSISLRGLRQSAPELLERSDLQPGRTDQYRRWRRPVYHLLPRRRRVHDQGDQDTRRSGRVSKVCRRTALRGAARHVRVAN